MNKSKKREIIIKLMENRVDHPTAIAIFNEAKEIDRTIGIATIYRGLNALVENGTISKYNIDGEDHFDYNVISHSHFICEKCHKIYDLFGDKLSIDLEQNLEKLASHIDSREIIIKGICKNCKD